MNKHLKNQKVAKKIKIFGMVLNIFLHYFKKSVFS